MSQQINPVISVDEAEKLRSLLKAHDKARVSNNVWDMSKPVIVPYVYRKFPMTLYDHKASKPAWDEPAKTAQKIDYMKHHRARFVTKIVESEEELAQDLQEGWQETPPDFDTMAPRRGRPPKSEAE